MPTALVAPFVLSSVSFSDFVHGGDTSSTTRCSEKRTPPERTRIRRKQFFHNASQNETKLAGREDRSRSERVWKKPSCQAPGGCLQGTTSWQLSIPNARPHDHATVTQRARGPFGSCEWGGQMSFRRWTSNVIPNSPKRDHASQSEYWNSSTKFLPLASLRQLDWHCRKHRFLVSILHRLHFLLPAMMLYFHVLVFSLYIQCFCVSLPVP